MKTAKNKVRGLYLQKRNNRWKWMVGATAATSAGVTASQATTITVNLLNNYISATGGNHLNADLTGDGHPDLTITRPSFFRYTTRTGTDGSYHVHYKSFAAVNLNGIHAQGYHYFVPGLFTAQLASQITSYGTLTGSIPIFFKDLHINGGKPTAGSLGVTVSDVGSGPTIQLDTFTYNDPPTGRGAAVPDQGSSLALMAMGAAGVIALRRSRAT
jgi:hypothetical protein